MNHLKKLRKEADLTIQGLATKCGVSKSYAWELENDNCNPSITMAYRFGAVLGKTVYEIWPDKTKIVEEITRRVEK